MRTTSGSHESVLFHFFFQTERETRGVATGLPTCSCTCMPVCFPFAQPHSTLRPHGVAPGSGAWPAREAAWLAASSTWLRLASARAGCACSGGKTAAPRSCWSHSQCTAILGGAVASACSAWAGVATRRATSPPKLATVGRSVFCFGVCRSQHPISTRPFCAVVAGQSIATTVDCQKVGLCVGAALLHSCCR